ncbi:hypothetical protein DL98DRAFT_599191 [Cadophora sp. DSE1049]|nr:hypothetical protein DL98DRAFT_599191 [Cadophora sp. DSE1049]
MLPASVFLHLVPLDQSSRHLSQDPDYDDSPGLPPSAANEALMRLFLPLERKNALELFTLEWNAEDHWDKIHSFRRKRSSRYLHPTAPEVTGYFGSQWRRIVRRVDGSLNLTTLILTNAKPARPELDEIDLAENFTYLPLLNLVKSLASTAGTRANFLDAKLLRDRNSITREINGSNSLMASQV